MRKINKKKIYFYTSILDRVPESLSISDNVSPKQLERYTNLLPFFHTVANLPWCLEPKLTMGHHLGLSLASLERQATC